MERAGGYALPGPLHWACIPCLHPCSKQQNSINTSHCRHLFNKPRMRNVVDDAQAPDGRLLLLDEALTSEAGGSRGRCLPAA